MFLLQPIENDSSFPGAHRCCIATSDFDEEIEILIQWNPYWYAIFWETEIGVDEYFKAINLFFGGNEWRPFNCRSGGATVSYDNEQPDFQTQTLFMSIPVIKPRELIADEILETVNWIRLDIPGVKLLDSQTQEELGMTSGPIGVSMMARFDRGRNFFTLVSINTFQPVKTISELIADTCTENLEEPQQKELAVQIQKALEQLKHRAEN